MITSKNIHSEVKNRLDLNIVHLAATTMPISGGNGDGAGFAGPGSTCVDNSTSIIYVNENTAALPVWSPLHWDQPNLMGLQYRGVGVTPKAIAETTATLTGVQGLRVFGEGIVTTEAGITLGTSVEGSHVADLITSNDAGGDNTSAGYQDGTVSWQPDTHGGMVIDCIFTHVTAITARSFFMGFLGTAANGLVVPVTGSSTTLTLVQDDMCGIMMDSDLTDADGYFAFHNKSNAAASLATTATNIDLSSTVPAAATYHRLRVEVSADGDMRILIDNALVGARIAIALDVNEECTPVIGICTTTTTAATIRVKQLQMWTSRGIL